MCCRPATGGQRQGSRRQWSSSRRGLRRRTLREGGETETSGHAGSAMTIAKSAKRNLRDCRRNATVQSPPPRPGGWLTRIDSPTETAALKRSLREADTYAQVC